MQERITEAEISMVLDTYMYMNYVADEKQEYSVSQMIDDMGKRPEYQQGGKYFGEYQILQQAAENPQVGNLMVKYQSSQMGYDTGTCACTFVDETEGKVFIAYRGSGDGEWPDNGLGLTTEVTTQQRRALDYFEQVVEEEQLDGSMRVIVTGHSKGGNKAQFVTMETRYDQLISKCYSVDGQGFSEQAVERWKTKYGKDGYEDRIARLCGISGENDFASAFGCIIIPEEQTRYLATPIDGENDGRNIAGTHDIKYMFATKTYDDVTGTYITHFQGRKNSEVTQAGVLRRYTLQLSAAVMALPVEQRAGAAMVIMQFVESLHGSKEGINGEQASFKDFMAFIKKGIPAIADITLKTPEGRSFLEECLYGGSFTAGISQVGSVKIQYPELKKSVQGLSAISIELQKMAEQIDECQREMPWYLLGKTMVNVQLKYAVEELDKINRKLKKMAELQTLIAETYHTADMASREIGSAQRNTSS